MKKTLIDYDFPQQLKEMNLEELELLSYEIRDFLIKSFANRGPFGL